MFSSIVNGICDRSINFLFLLKFFLVSEPNGIFSTSDHSSSFFFVIGFCLSPVTNILSGLSMFGTPSDLSPLIICSLKNFTGSSCSPIKPFKKGDH